MYIDIYEIYIEKPVLDISHTLPIGHTHLFNNYHVCIYI